MAFPRNVAAHYAIIGQQACVISGAMKPTIHHAQGPSIRARLVALGIVGKFDGTKSLSMRGTGDALLLPLAAQYHTGAEGIDAGLGRTTWEETFGAQADFIDRVSSLIGYDMWELHRLWYEPVLPKIFKRRL